ncbi:MAG TPA: NAD-dependent epimerase/dehydratase family protein [Candidatus Acidoferrales bacterium]|jgi:UDP-glucose 4-epimerase|nr:NAD-dependent epimerase/dehydratase family protein [Candidatus Acidoferrales bacterium]
MRALITGGAGFIGSHLAERILRSGNEVLLLDNLSTGSKENISPLEKYDRARFILGAVENRVLLAELVDECDIIFHLAAAVGVRLIVESPVHTIQTNVAGTHLVLEAAAEKRKLVFLASSSEVYGKNANVPFDEDADLVLGPTTKGRWSYAASKAVDEFLALAYWKEKNLPVIVGRFFNTVGPRQTDRYGMVMPALIRQALAGLPLTVFGSGKQSRCFCDVQDCVEAIVRLVSTDRAVGEVINVGSDREITIEALAELIRERTASPSDITYIPYERAYEPGFEDMPRRVPSLRKLERLTGFRPQIRLADTIDRVARFMAEKEEMRLAAATL